MEGEGLSAQSCARSLEAGDRENIEDIAPLVPWMALGTSCPLSHKPQPLCERHHVAQTHTQARRDTGPVVTALVTMEPSGGGSERGSLLQWSGARGSAGTVYGSPGKALLLHLQLSKAK